MHKRWSEKAWDDYLYWQSQDKRTLRKINALICDIERAAKEGDKPLGKGERLRYSESGAMSVRIDKTNRLVYKVEDADTLALLSCRGHYE